MARSATRSATRAANRADPVVIEQDPSSPGARHGGSGGDPGSPADVTGPGDPTRASAEGIPDAPARPSHDAVAGAAAGEAHPSLRIAVYPTDDSPPIVHEVTAPSAPQLIQRTTDAVLRLAADFGGRIPPVSVRAVVENLLHAGFAGVTVTIARGGNLIRLADRGPGISEKDRAMRLGFTTADHSQRRFIDGVGAGLPLARRLLEDEGGTLTLEDNLGGGSVVTLEVPPPPTDAAPAERVAAELTPRQVRALLLVMELQPVGPTALADELGLSPATAYRELVQLERLGLVASDEGGHRLVTPEGLEQIRALL